MAAKPYSFAKHYVITDDQGLSAEQMLTQLEACLKNGFRLIQLRAHRYSETAYRSLATTALALTQQYAATLLLNAPISLAQALASPGVHLTSQRLMTVSQRPLPKPFIIAASCHNATEVQHANAIQADLITLSPVLPTPSHPNAPPLGWTRFRELATLANMPVFALGGLTQEDLTQAQHQGAYGIAGIRDFFAN